MADDLNELLASVGHTSDETEFYSPIPQGYVPGKTKYVVVLGTVMSGLGKGIFASSLAKILKDKGLKVAPIKMEGYLNLDSGTLNPFRHGEVFVLDDGMETDMDLGTYERMLNENLGRRNFTTSGQIFTRVLDRERHGGYLGRDVQMIPHVTGEVKNLLRELAAKSQADVVFIEVGGTVGDYENGYFIEALREMAYEEGDDSVCVVALTYVMEPKSLGEQKSKAAQLGLRQVMQAGLVPHIIACRCPSPVNDKVRQKISMFSNVPLSRVFSMHDVESIYLVPEMLREAGMDREVLTLLKLHDRVNQRAEDNARRKWVRFVDDLLAPKEKTITIGVTGKYTAIRDAYASIDKALEHCSAHANCKVNIEWIDTGEMWPADVIDPEVRKRYVADRLRGLHGIIVPGGFGNRGVEGKIEVVRYARENKIPFLGICLGLQMAVVEYARNVCKLEDANSTEFSPRCKNPVIDILPEQKKIEGLGGNMRLGAKDIDLTPNSLISRLYDNNTTKRLRFRHRYEVDPKYIETLTANGLIFSGRHPTQPIMQMLELPQSQHPYFVGTQAHPCLTSRPLNPDGMFLGLVKAALARAYNQGTLVDGVPAPKTNGTSPTPPIPTPAMAMTGK
ncbi:MAG TPA: CTP synthase (glutamine hydrolyzing) [Phycisphaerae bacterium]|nr:CTP synthase (glutamine hydrolyzing) [Phycisphaerae bacterium]